MARKTGAQQYKDLMDVTQFTDAGAGIILDSSLDETTKQAMLSAGGTFGDAMSMLLRIKMDSIPTSLVGSKILSDAGKAQGVEVDVVKYEKGQNEYRAAFLSGGRATSSSTGHPGRG